MIKFKILFFHAIQFYNHFWNSNFTFNWTPLIHASYEGHIEIIQHLLAQPGIEINFKTILIQNIHTIQIYFFHLIQILFFHRIQILFFIIFKSYFFHGIQILFFYKIHFFDHFWNSI